MSARGLTTALAAAAVVLLSAPTASAAVPDGADAGSADLGSARVVVDGNAGTLAPLAACDAAHPGSATSSGDALDDVASYGAGTTDCAVDAAARTSTMRADGTNFRLDLLRAYGGPTIGFSSYHAGCTGQTGSTGANFSLSGYYGVALPQRLPTNYTVTVPGAHDGDPPMATLTFGEVVPPPQQDGSIGIRVLHVRLFPRGGPASGDLYVGSVHCTPTT